MKKVIIKVFIVSIVVLLLPFTLTLLFSDKGNDIYSLETMDFNVYYEKGSDRQKLDFNQYLIGVVAASMPAGYNLEALKAQAVIARTYALYNISMLTEEEPDKKDFLTSELGLPYIGLKELEQYFGKENYVDYFTKLENSVNGTAGEVLVYNNELILPVFFDTGSGFTRNAKEAWGIDVPYLVSVQSKQDVTSIDYLKISEFDIPVLLGVLKQYYNIATLSEDKFFDEISVAERDSVGYATKINLGSLTVSGEEFAKVLGLNSNNFYIEEYEGKARIICTGVGHGIGLSQYGANAMAGEGYPYTEILYHYYTGVQLVNVNNQD